MAKATDASALIDKQIAELPDWRGRRYAELRKLINAAGPDIKEEWKWGTAVWTDSGNVCAVGAFKDHLKINFFNGVMLPDPRHLFNAGLDAKASRSIDLREEDKVDGPAVKALVRAALQHNESKR